MEMSGEKKEVSSLIKLSNMVLKKVEGRMLYEAGKDVGMEKPTFAQIAF